jgi:hypothetical protein
MQQLLAGIALVLICGGSAIAADNSCRATAGEKIAADLVKQCTEISEATHPPCNALNPCNTMVDEIRRWCVIRHRYPNIPSPTFCTHYLNY